MNASRHGLTIVETLIALAILGVVISILTTATLSNVQNTAIAGGRTQATQVLSYLGRLVAGADSALTSAETTVWDYGDLSGQFPELRQLDGRADPDSYRAAVTDVGEVAFLSTSMRRYTVEVCWRTAGDETCVAGETLGPELAFTADEPGPLPGVN